MIGVIYTTTHTDYSTITIEFHDKSTQRPIHFTDHHNYSLACLGSRGALFASISNDSEPSTLYYKTFDSWSSNSDWNLSLSDGENVKCMALLKDNIMVATDQKYLRYLTFSGLQVGLKCLPGPVVTCSGWESWGFLVYHLGAVAHGEQNLGFELLDIRMEERSHSKTGSIPTVGQIRHQGRLPLSPQSQLRWIGFSELSGLPITFDTSGVLRSLCPHLDWNWVPILDTREYRKKSSSNSIERYWALGATLDKFVCLILKGGIEENGEPGFPRPVMSDITLEIPMIQSLSGDGINLEER